MPGGLTSTPSSEALAAKVLSVEEVGSRKRPSAPMATRTPAGRRTQHLKATSTDGKSSEKGGRRTTTAPQRWTCRSRASGTLGSSRTSTTSPWAPWAPDTGASYPAWGVMFAKMLGLFFYFVPKCTESDDGTPYINGVDESGRYES